MLSAMLLSACTDESMPTNDIEYSTVPLGFSCSECTTRGAEANTVNEFAVSSLYYSDGSSYPRFFLEGQVVNYENNTWTYSPLKYWPKSGTLDFYAFSPKDITGLESLTFNHSVYPAWLMKYNVPYPQITSINELSGNISQTVFGKANDAERQKDLLLATKLNEVCTEQTPINRTISLKFTHPLAGLKLQLSTSIAPSEATHVIISFAPMCTGGTIALDKSTTTAVPDLVWTLDESEATFYQGYDLSSFDSDNKTFFLPPQELKNFTITARFYKSENGAYTLLGTKTSNRNSLKLERGKTTTLILKN